MGEKKNLGGLGMATTVLAAHSVLEDLLAALVSTASFTFVEIVSYIFTE